MDNGQIANLLARAANGEGDMESEDPLRIDGWEIVLFIDAGDVDYVEVVVAPDGSTADYGGLCEADSSDAVDLLSSVERERLNQRIDAIGSEVSLMPRNETVYPPKACLS